MILRHSARSAVETSVRPGLAAYAEALAACLPTARPDDKVGLCHLPGGEESYAAALRYFTTTDKSAQAIHEIVLRWRELANGDDGRVWRGVPNRKWYARNRGEIAASKEVVLFHRLVRN